MNKVRTPAERITLAKQSVDAGASTDYAIAHALIAIAEILLAEAEPNRWPSPEPTAGYRAGGPNG